MHPINGIFKNGQIILDGVPDWPEGCRLHIEPMTREATDGDEPETPEEIEEWLRWYHSLEPLEFTLEEEASLAAWRRQVKEYDIAKSRQREELFP